MSDESGGAAFVHMPNDQLGRLSLIEAIRANTDAVQRLTRQSERHDTQFERIAADVHEMRTNIALIQHSGLRPMVEEHDRRIAALEELENRRIGREGAWSAILRSPAVQLLAVVGAAIAAAFAWLRNGGQP